MAQTGGVLIEGWADLDEDPVRIFNNIIAGNEASGGSGGGVGLFYYTGSLLLENNTISGNCTELCPEDDPDIGGGTGGGVAIFHQTPDKRLEATLKRNLITGNTAARQAGVHLVSIRYNGLINLENNIISNNISSCNSTVDYGTGISFVVGAPGNNNTFKMVNNTVAGNQGEGANSYGMYLRIPFLDPSLDPSNEITVRNSIVYFNDHNNLMNTGPLDGFVIEYNCVDPIPAGFTDQIYGNIIGDPLFVYQEEENYYLQAGSPCIEKGDPDPAYENTDGSRNHMGAFGGPEAGIVGADDSLSETGYIGSSLTLDD